MPIYKQMLSGNMVDLLNPKTSDIKLDDILKPLSIMPRYDCHSILPVYVLNHSLAVADAVENPESVPYALVHDFEEAFTGDIGTPVKQVIGALGGPNSKLALKTLSDIHTMNIWKAFGLDPNPPKFVLDDVKKADIIALSTERRWLSTPTIPWEDFIEAVDPDPSLEHYYQLGVSDTIKLMTNHLYKFCPKVPR